jgi:L-iditol 2-dehydrogenase
MRVVRLHGVEDLRLGDEPAPHAAPGRTLVRVTAVGLCGSDLHWYTEGGIGDDRLSAPLVGGHEFAGEVAEGPLAGRAVAVDPAMPCGVCEVCLTGYRNLCPTVAFAGSNGVDGGLRELVSWPSELLHPLPESLTAVEGAMLEPLGVALHTWDLGHAAVGATVAVIGCGPIGLCLLQVARAAGAATVIAVEPLEHRRAAAAALGATVVVDAAADEVGAAVADATHGLGVDVAYEAAGNDEAVGLAVASARPGARVVLAGIPSNDSTTFRAGPARRKGLTLVLVRRMGEVYPRATRLVAQGKVDVASIVTARYGLTDVEDAFRSAAAREGLKVVVEPQR